MTHIRLPRLAGVAIALLALAAVVPGVAASPRSGDIHLEKECHLYDGTAGSFCTITSSSVREIVPGSRVYYLEAADFGSMTLDTDIVIDGPGTNDASGHVTLSLVTGEGTVTISGGAGVFDGFQASAAVYPTGGANWAWDGTYSFGSRS